MRAIVTASDTTNYTQNSFDVVWYGRYENGKRMVHQFTAPFKPYYYLESAVGTYKSIDDKKLAKVEKNFPNEVKAERESLKRNGIQTYEADIPYTERVLYDLGIKKAVDLDTMQPCPDTGINMRVGVFDIETDDRYGFARPQDAKQEVLAIGYKDSYTGNTLLFTTIPPEKIIASELIKAVNSYKVRFLSLKTEKHMLGAFFGLLESEHAPDLLEGWNSDRYDIPYLTNRAKLLGIQAPFKQVGTLDLMAGYKRKHENKTISASLDYVSEQLLGEHKVEHEMGFYEMYSKHPLLFLKYLYRDVDLTYKIDQQQKITKFFYGLSRKAGTLEIGKWNADYIIDSRIFHAVRGKLVAKTKTKTQKDKTDGSHVFPAQRGLLERPIVVLDFKTEYPAIISSLNLSWDTVKRPEEPDDPTDIRVNGHRFTTKFRGILPQIIDELIADRDAIKAQMKKAAKEEYEVLDDDQRVTKELTNAFYGDLGNEYSRWYDYRIQPTITFVGREHVLFVADKIRNLVPEVLPIA